MTRRRALVTTGWAGWRQMHPLQWLGQRDRDFAALRRAGRTAIVMPAMFAVGDKVIGNAALATFAAFGAFAMLLLVDFGGPMVSGCRRRRRSRSWVAYSSALARWRPRRRGSQPRRWRSSAS